MGAMVVITDVGPGDSYYRKRHKYIGLIGELNEEYTHPWDDGWSAVYMRPNMLSVQLLGIPDYSEQDRRYETEMCFYRAKYRKLEKGE